MNFVFTILSLLLVMYLIVFCLLHVPPDSVVPEIELVCRGRRTLLRRGYVMISSSLMSYYV